MKKSTLVLLTAAASLLSGCDSSKIGGVNPTAPPAKLLDAGWKSSWSPDGRQLVHGTGQGGGLEVLDLRTRQTTVLIANAKDPAWSPDGRWIAFIREESYNQYLTEEVWVVPARGGEPRRVVAGGFPSWSADGRRLFVHSRRDNQILAVNPSEPASQPAIFFTNTPSWYFSVSPDQTRVAFGCPGRLDIRNRATGQTVAAWPTPMDGGLLPAWSPDGRLVAFGGFDDSRLGLWVFEVATGRARPVLEGNYTMPAWNRDGRWLAFDERRDSRCIWIVGRSYIDNLFKDVSGATSVRKEMAQLRAQAAKGDAQAQSELGKAFWLGSLGVATNYVEAAKWFRKAAEQNDAISQHNLGVCYRDGQGVTKDYVEAVKWFHKAAEQNYAMAQVNLGRCYEDGEGVAKDAVEAVKWYRKAAEHNDAQAQHNLGFCYAIGQGVAKNEVEAAKWFRQAADQNHPAAQSNLGNCYADGQGVAKDEVQAVKWWRRAAEQNHAAAQYNLGVAYRDGVGVAKNGREAVKWYRQAAEQNDPMAQNSLGICYYTGQDVGKDVAEAAKWYRKGADQGFANAQFNLGGCYEKGEGVPQDAAEAVKWYRKAADQGYAKAQYNLGVCYTQGTGAPQDSTEAVKWYRNAAEQNLAGAQHNLGVCYEKGEGVPPDPAEAAKWYRKAAEQGYPLAQCNLGLCCFNGQGVGKDEVQAYKWWLLAGAQGNEVAKKNITLLERELTRAQLAEGQKRAGDFKPSAVPPLDPQQGEADGNLLGDLRARAGAGEAQAQNELGEALYIGKREVTRNAVAAVECFRQAAGQNYPAAQSNLGVCYERGDGVAKYEVEAYKWDLLAAAQGDSKGKRNASMLELLLSPEQIAEGKRRAQDWLEQRKKPSTNNR